MKASLQLKMGQQLQLTPQLKQAIRLLQLSSFDLQQEIQEVLSSNPMLEAEEQTPEQPDSPEIIEARNTLEDQELQWSMLDYNTSYNSNFDQPDYNIDNIKASTDSLQNHLAWQLGLTSMSDQDRAIATMILDAINEDGQLSLSLNDLQQALKQEGYTLEKAEIEAVRHLIQHFDPVGCAFYTLADCLLAQLDQLQDNYPHLELTRQIVASDLEALAQHQYPYLLKKYLMDDKVLESIIHTIQALHPKPGYLINQSMPDYVIPDVIIKKVGAEWQISLNQSVLPKISINEGYANLINRSNSALDSQFLKHNLQEAKWFLRSIESRQETLYKVTKAILTFQNDFFEHGEEAMKPLVLKDVADAIGMHESTVSRVTTQKYAHTPRGVFELKYFFSSAVGDERQGETSSTAIKATIKTLVSQENKEKPLSDDKLSSLLEAKGMHVARRTISKYREEIGIPPSRERKIFLQ